jgi:hypothetical protein
MFEVAHVEALKKYGEEENNQFFFMQTPPKHAIESIIKQLQGKDIQAQKDEVKAMILKGTDNFFISDKIKLKFPNQNIDLMVAQVVDAAFKKFPDDLFNVINDINAALTLEIHKAVSPANMCMVCKDGIDRGHAFKLNLQKYLGLNDLIHKDVRAQVVAGRNINFNGETYERYRKAEKSPQATNTPVSSVISAGISQTHLAQGAVHDNVQGPGLNIEPGNQKKLP